jgi:hypothetical protein
VKSGGKKGGKVPIPADSLVRRKPGLKSADRPR